MLKFNSNLYERDLIDKYSDVFDSYNNKMHGKMDLVVCNSCFQMTQRSKMKIISLDEINENENEILNQLVQSNKRDIMQFCYAYC